MWISSIQDSGKLNGANSRLENSKVPEQANHKHKHQLPSPEFVAKMLIDLHKNDRLTITQIKDQKEALNALIKVCKIATCVQLCSSVP